MADHGGAEDPGEGSSKARPSFTSFWKRVKDREKKSKGKALEKSNDDDNSSEQNVGGSSVGGATTAWSQSQSHSHADDESQQAEGDEPEDKELAAKEKAQHRRAQVRKAQIQHRQRKANYVKQLELDVSELRDLIAQAQHDTALIRKENTGIIEILKCARDNRQNAPANQAASFQTNPAADFTMPSLGAMLAAGNQELFPTGQMSGLDLNQDQPMQSNPSSDIFSNINIDDITVSISINEVLGTPAFAVSSNAPSSSVPGYVNPAPSLLEGENPIPMPASLTPRQERVGINWILALESICWNHFAPSDFHARTANDTEDSNNHILMATALCMNGAPPSVYIDRSMLENVVPGQSQTTSISWQTSGISLNALHGLAQYNVDPTEVTPVEAWFELVAKYPLDMLFGPGVLTTLLIELKDLVRCVTYGAAMRREPFETVITRVLGPPLLSTFQYPRMLE